MDVLAIDPGTKVGGALKLAGFDPIAFTMRSPSARQIYDAVRWAMRLADGRRLRLVTEDQFLGRGKKANPQSTLSVARSAERWLTIGDLLGLRCDQIMTEVWRAPVIADVDASLGDKKRRTLIKVARLWPRVMFYDGAVGDPLRLEMLETLELPQDPVDALGMMRWATME